MLVPLILFVSAVSRAIGESAAWYMGPCLCAISLTLAVLSRVMDFSPSDMGHALVNMF